MGHEGREIADLSDQFGQQHDGQPCASASPGGAVDGSVPVGSVTKRAVGAAPGSSGAGATSSVRSASEANFEKTGAAAAPPDCSVSGSVMTTRTVRSVPSTPPTKVDV